ncbi:MAG: (2Fe-2S) ferredoxin domain-containing protein [Oscillospiraceae bacterium]|nr:(2Fe-2S) ferredoxin domain-containing protein [Oscillospiraceae bacterium]
MLKVSVCVGSSCHLKGSYNVIQTFQQIIEEDKLYDKIEMEAQFCMRACQRGVSVTVDSEVISVSPETAREIFYASILSRIK